MSTQTFAAFLSEAGYSLDDDTLTQGQFASMYTNWLEQVVIPAFLGEEDIGAWSVDINQNDEGAPRIVADGLSEEELASLNEAFAELFADGEAIDVLTGKKLTERWFSELKEVEDDPWGENPFEVTLTDGQTIAGDDGEVGDPGDEGNDADREREGTDWNYFAATPGSDGGDGTNGGDAIIVDAPDDYTAILINSTGNAPNFILGGDAGAGGDGGDGGDGIPAGNGDQNDGADGGAGGDGGVGGHAIVNGDLSDVYIIGDADLTVLGGLIGDGGDGGEGGDGKGSGDDGTGGAEGSGGDGMLRTAAFSDQVNVDASAFESFLTISGSDEDDTFVAGTGGSNFYATLGSDEYTAGDGIDTFIFTSADQSDGTIFTDSISGFEFGVDLLDFSAIATDDFAFVTDGDLLLIDLDGDGTDMIVEIAGLNAYEGELADLFV